MNPVRIIRVEPTEQYFSINWQIGTRCNYDCMYCSPDWHDSTSKFRDLRELQQAWISIVEKTKSLNLRYKISFTGGELTVNRNFLPFVTWLRQNYSQQLFKLLVTTNGSASTQYYKKMFESVDNITFSLHTEHADEQKFFDMILDLSQQLDSSKFLHVAIMNEFWNQDRISGYVKLLNQHGISHSVNEINYRYQTREHPIFLGKLNLDL